MTSSRDGAGFFVEFDRSVHFRLREAISPELDWKAEEHVNHGFHWRSRPVDHVLQSAFCFRFAIDFADALEEFRYSRGIG